jgi:hypothetical protein
MECVDTLSETHFTITGNHIAELTKAGISALLSQEYPPLLQEN